ncbi:MULTISPECIES: flagellar basal body rod C-terminal domain-containing protein [unclassified Pseudodesulfovibrio]|uniref:flagellar hook-associated protein FlgK n=1 Tax=unclassified Pseudodesulfovibrio TaxID=2661612 RepID=UPI000FEC01A3|nr:MULTISPECIES: flagellar basal body rod C-terminal domain-containing protein [unclassified Pseudodesulfovibrio]MCJ2164542.1 flagellar basal body protein [Pseudodesulfovibrio sp. S3-i]RWU04740.1 flagellar biosynthesis protein FlgK [Pseudodesulfovibrio sp. S3]
MINNLWNIGKTALQNAQVAVNNASNNIANADTTGYQRTSVVSETSSSITVLGLTVGTGADITSIQSEWDKFVESQYLDALSDLATQSISLDYLSQLDSLLNQSEGGLSDILEDFVDGWNELVTDPDSLSAREDLLGDTETLVYALNSTAEQLEQTVETINSEIQDQVATANELIEGIAEANAAIAINPDDTQAVSDRSQMIRELDALIGVDVLYQSNGQVTILTEEGYTMVDGTETHSLVYQSAKVNESLMRDSDYDGTLEYSGTSSEELLLEFVSTGADGTARFKVSTDGGETWLTDENGDTMLYTADGQDGSVEIEGVEIWFDGATTDHAEGDRYIIMAKSGLYWESGDGGLTNITPLTDDSGQSVSGRTSSGSLAGLFNTRDDTVVPTLDDLDDLTEALIWEVNSAHSQGAGLEHHTSLTGSYSVDDSSAMLSNSGLNYADNIQAGDLELVTYDADGNVSTSSIISVDPATDSLDDVVADINTAFAGELTASVTADGQLQISAATDVSFEIAGDSSNLMAALGLNTYFTGTSASTIAVDSYVSTDTSHINAGVVGDDGLVATGNNDVASILATITEQTSTVGNTQTTLSGALATLVANVGSAASSAELQQTYAQTSAEYLYEQQASTTEVNVDEELIELTKYQQAFEAASQIINVTREMMDTVLDMV